MVAYELPELFREFAVLIVSPPVVLTTKPIWVPASRAMAPVWASRKPPLELQCKRGKLLAAAVLFCGYNGQATPPRPVSDASHPYAIQGPRSISDSSPGPRVPAGVDGPGGQSFLSHRKPWPPLRPGGNLMGICGDTTGEYPHIRRPAIHWLNISALSTHTPPWGQRRSN